MGIIENKRLRVDARGAIEDVIVVRDSYGTTLHKAGSVSR
jgi:hypothetical protein